VKITFIGGGNMAQAIIGGLVKKGFAAKDFVAVEPVPEARDRIAKLGARAVAAARDAAPFGDLLVMAVKPQQMREAASSVGPLLKKELVLSIAAGIRLSDLQRWLGGHALLARCMPNTPALVGEGVTGLYCAPAVSAEARQLAANALEAVGTVVAVGDEALLDPVTAVSGSGPAYVFLFIEAMQQAARELGLTPEQARALSIQTFSGAAHLAAASEDDVAVLRERVTSKGGTTERALASLREDRVVEAIARAIKAANARARELGDELGRDS
jgi:pyrroline-5-carboxylate reductase